MSTRAAFVNRMFFVLVKDLRFLIETFGCILKCNSIVMRLLEIYEAIKAVMLTLNFKGDVCKMGNFVPSVHRVFVILLN